MKDESILNIETRDAMLKIDLYIQRILKANGSMNQIEKICHIASQICIKYSDRHQFSEQLCQKFNKYISQNKNYYLLYLFDIVIKNNLNTMKFAHKHLQSLFKLVWTQVNSQPKTNSSSIKLQCMKAMVLTWGAIYSQKIQQSIKRWLQINYQTNLSLEEKHEKIFNQNKQRYKTRDPLLSPKNIAEIIADKRNGNKSIENSQKRD